YVRGVGGLPVRIAVVHLQGDRLFRFDLDAAAQQSSGVGGIGGSAFIGCWRGMGEAVRSLYREGEDRTGFLVLLDCNAAVKREGVLVKAGRICPRLTPASVLKLHRLNRKGFAKEGGKVKQDWLLCS